MHDNSTLQSVCWRLVRSRLDTACAPFSLSLNWWTGEACSCPRVVKAREKATSQTVEDACTCKRVQVAATGRGQWDQRNRKKDP